MPKVLVSNNTELLRHFTAPPFKRLGLELLVAGDADDARRVFDQQAPALAVLDLDLRRLELGGLELRGVELGGLELRGVELGGVDVSKHIKQRSPTTRVVLVAGKRLSGDQMREVSESGCDELLIAPMTSDELHDVVAIQLGEPRPGTEAFRFEVELASASGAWSAAQATVSNLSVDGVRLVMSQVVTEGQPIRIAITPDGEPPLAIRGTTVWAQPRDGTTVLGVSFDELDERARRVLAKLTQWQVVTDGERIRVVLRGDFTEATRFDELLPALVGRVVFDTAQVTYMNSLGVRAWCEFLRKARIQGYEFHACSVPFILQASMVRDVIGRGTVTSFFAPFHCIGCDHEEERLLQSAAILATATQGVAAPGSGGDHLSPPVFKCPSCGGALELDDLPERYFAFLEDEVD